MTKTVFRGQIVKLIKLHNSKNGNPKFLVRIYKFDETIELRTQSDAMFAYAINERYIGRYATFTVSGVKRQVITNITTDREV